ncbi:hypothetical protein LTR08_008442 [Meristemomyces frigidus]|nr:hypothetical protein LTR08_008442 [Meristemomyces frigidus]
MASPHHPLDRATPSRKRSRSPRDAGKDTKDAKRHRSRSPYHQSQHSHHHHRHNSSRAAHLPLNAHHLHKHDIDTYRAVFAEYLDIQKRIDVATLSENEVKGRWKSFLGKWNRGELAEGWYDHETKQRADERSQGSLVVVDSTRERVVPERTRDAPERTQVMVAPSQATEEQLNGNEDEDDDDGSYGPALPHPDAVAQRRVGPAVPSVQDLQHRRELADEDRSTNITSLRHERKLDRATQKSQLEELAPRAEPGSRERQLEKKRETAATNRDFRDAKEGGAVEEVGDGELMGDDGADGFKAQVKKEQRKKSEREVRKEEVLRAREAEREERLAVYRRKEEGTVEMLRGLAKARYG